MIKTSISQKQLREFGILVGLGFPILIGWIIPAIGGHYFRAWTLWIGIPLLIIGIVKPWVLFYPYKFWIQLGNLLGWINSRIILGIIFILVLPFVYQRFEFSSLSIVKWKQILSFALPFLPAGLFAMAMEVADRYVLKLLTDLETVGIYNAGYKIGVLMLLVVNGFNM